MKKLVPFLVAAALLACVKQIELDNSPPPAESKYVEILARIQQSARAYYQAEIGEPDTLDCWGLTDADLNWDDCRIGLDSVPNRVYAVPVLGDRTADSARFVLFTFRGGSMQIGASHLVEVRYRECDDDCPETDGIAARFFSPGGEERFPELDPAQLFGKRSMLSRTEGDYVIWLCGNCGHMWVGREAPEYCPVCWGARHHYIPQPRDIPASGDLGGGGGGGGGGSGAGTGTGTDSESHSRPKKAHLSLLADKLSPSTLKNMMTKAINNPNFKFIESTTTSGGMQLKYTTDRTTGLSKMMVSISYNAERYAQTSEMGHDLSILHEFMHPVLTNERVNLLLHHERMLTNPVYDAALRQLYPGYTDQQYGWMKLASTSDVSAYQNMPPAEKIQMGEFLVGKGIILVKK